ALRAAMEREDVRPEKLRPPGRERPRMRRKAEKKKPRPYGRGSQGIAPGSDLLSHGETPHYHRRGVVSLPSSGWDRVVPTRYGRQANGLADCSAIGPIR